MLVEPQPEHFTDGPGRDLVQVDVVLWTHLQHADPFLVHFGRGAHHPVVKAIRPDAFVVQHLSVVEGKYTFRFLGPVCWGIFQ